MHCSFRSSPQWHPITFTPWLIFQTTTVFSCGQNCVMSQVYTCNYSLGVSGLVVWDRFSAWKKAFVENQQSSVYVEHQTHRTLLFDTKRKRYLELSSPFTDDIIDKWIIFLWKQVRNSTLGMCFLSDFSFWFYYERSVVLSKRGTSLYFKWCLIPVYRFILDVGRLLHKLDSQIDWRKSHHILQNLIMKPPCSWKSHFLQVAACRQWVSNMYFHSQVSRGAWTYFAVNS